eukprot:TRINITY_DN2179_c0_g1_i1.p1 TRINITY_DN2179_c0_g1~~TRINITY_DN2179_c0_g1_i1.p1  ORF type:complete len:534 (+),score=92.38 TRINITY_DN2179_c0_g1_i1:121-1722(+)
MASKVKNILVWFRNDLRIHDNEVLFKAVQDASSILPVYVFDPRHFGRTRVGKFPRSGIHRTIFHLESVIDLKNSFKQLGGDLIIRSGEPEKILADLARQYKINSIYFQEEATSEETDVDKALKKSMDELKIEMKSFWGLTMYHKADLPYPSIDKIPDMYTNYRKLVEAKCHVRECFPTPKAVKMVEGVESDPMPDLAALQCSDGDIKTYAHATHKYLGGETQGKNRLKHYFWDTDFVAKYKETRNGLLGEDFSTKFSVWLWNGCLSPRFIYHEIKRYEKERVANDSTYWVTFELLWRDYFKFIGIKYGDKIFYLNGLQLQPYKYTWKKDEKLFAAWASGNTGYPFVDANMRELNATGFMSNRGRQNVSSFLVKDLGIDWRLGAEYFESVLVDHDPTSNYGNWQYQAGVGLDPRGDRHFNVVKQAHDYDPNAEYVLHWIPELKVLQEGRVPATHIHQPWLDRSKIKHTYPLRIHDVKFPYKPKEPKVDSSKSHDIRNYFSTSSSSSSSTSSSSSSSSGPKSSSSHKKYKGKPAM